MVIAVSGCTPAVVAAIATPPVLGAAIGSQVEVPRVTERLPFDPRQPDIPFTTTEEATVATLDGQTFDGRVVVTSAGEIQVVQDQSIVRIPMQRVQGVQRTSGGGTRAGRGFAIGLAIDAVAAVALFGLFVWGWSNYHGD